MVVRQTMNENIELKLRANILPAPLCASISSVCPCDSQLDNSPRNTATLVRAVFTHSVFSCAIHHSLSAQTTAHWLTHTLAELSTGFSSSLLFLRCMHHSFWSSFIAARSL